MAEPITIERIKRLVYSKLFPTPHVLPDSDIQESLEAMRAVCDLAMRALKLEPIGVLWQIEAVDLGFRPPESFVAKRAVYRTQLALRPFLHEAGVLQRHPFISGVVKYVDHDGPFLRSQGLMGEKVRWAADIQMLTLMVGMALSHQRDATRT